MSGAILAAGAIAAAIVALQQVLAPVLQEPVAPKVTLSAEAKGLVPLSLFGASLEEPVILGQAASPGDLDTVRLGMGLHPAPALSGVLTPGVSRSASAAQPVGSEGDATQGPDGFDADGPEAQETDEPGDAEADGSGEVEADGSGDVEADGTVDEHGDGSGDGDADGAGEHDGDGSGEDDAGPADDETGGPADAEDDEPGADGADGDRGGDADGVERTGEGVRPSPDATVLEAAELRRWEDFQTDVIAEVEATDPSLRLCETADCRLALLPLVEAPGEGQDDSEAGDGSTGDAPGGPGVDTDGDAAGNGTSTPVTVREVAEQLAGLFDDARTTPRKPDGSYEPLGVLVHARIEVEAGAPDDLTLAWALLPSGLDPSLSSNWVSRRSWVLPSEPGPPHYVPLWVPVPARPGAYEAQLEVIGDGAKPLDHATVPLIDQ